MMALGVLALAILLGRPAVGILAVVMLVVGE